MSEAPFGGFAYCVMYPIDVEVVGVKLSTYQNLWLPNFSVQAMREVLEKANLDWRSALVKAELDLEAVTRPGRSIPAKKELAFQLQFAALTRGRIDLWIKVAQAYTLGSFGVRGIAMLTAPTIEAFVTLVSRMDEGPGLMEITPLRMPDGALTGIEITYPEAPEELIPFSVYRDFISLVRTLPWLYGEPFPFTQVDFPFAEISNEVSSSVPCPINYSAEALRFRWDPEVSKHQLPFGDAFQHASWVKLDAKRLETVTADGDWPGNVIRVMESAPGVNHTLTNVAATLGVSPRTLQRKLEVTGNEFAQLRDETLYSLARDLLREPGHSISEISRKLGYANPASFSIAFKRWSGMSPTAFRNADRRKELAKTDLSIG